MTETKRVSFPSTSDWESDEFSLFSAPHSTDLGLIHIRRVYNWVARNHLHGKIWNARLGLHGEECSVLAAGNNNHYLFTLLYIIVDLSDTVLNRVDFINLFIDSIRWRYAPHLAISNLPLYCPRIEQTPTLKARIVWSRSFIDETRVTDWFARDANVHASFTVCNI